jgi:O-methyltransferase involved in polyketide biosynthesis
VSQQIRGSASQADWVPTSDGGSAPRGIDPNVPNVARMYDYYLGGKDNYAADRQVAQKVLDRFPEMRDVALANRQFMDDALRFLVIEAGIRQFLDLGSGLPTQRNVHEVVQELNPDAHVVYVDYDPVVCAHAKALLPADWRRTAVVQADLRHPDVYLGASRTRELIDFSQPVAVLLLAILHFIPDSDDPHAVVARLREVMAPGSYLAISHASLEGQPDRVHQAAGEYRDASAHMVFRTQAEILRFFGGMEFVEPGLVPPGSWRGSASRSTELPVGMVNAGHVGVARKP